MPTFTITKIKQWLYALPTDSGLKANNVILPPPSFRVGPKKPRWFWSDVIGHLTRQQSCDADQRADAEAA
jgi:hypothetical protein